MRNTILSVACLVFLLTSCEEKPPIINFGAGTSVDTTYVLDASAIPAAQPHNVLMEEFTGASCTNCPAAHELLNNIENDHPGRINLLGLYITGPLQTKPPHGAKYDFRDKDATTISADIYGGVNILPSGGIDRVPVNGNIRIDKGLWISNFESQLATTQPVNVEVAAAFDTASGEGTVVVTLTYTDAVSFDHNLSIAVSESSIIDVQEYPATDPVHPNADEEYDFENVFRGMLTTVPSGDAILPSITDKEAGRVVVRKYTFALQSLVEDGDDVTVINPKNCKVVAFVTRADDHRVLQSAQTKLMP